MTQTTGKAAAKAAAKTLLDDKIALVNALGAAIDVHRGKVQAVTTAQTAEREAAEQARAAYTAAQAGGWTATQLNQAGLRRAPTRRTRKTSTAATPTPTDSAAGVHTGSAEPTPDQPPAV